MNSGAESTSAALHEIKQLLKQIATTSGRITYVAKNETSQLRERCTSISNSLSDRSPALKLFNLETKSELINIDDQLVAWSKFNRPRSLMKRGEIEGGVTGFIEKLGSIFPHLTPATRCHERPSRQNTQQKTLDNHPVEASQPPSVKRLDGEITKQEDTPFAGGKHCEVWVGLWRKGNGKGNNREVLDDEKVALKMLKATSSPGAYKRLLRELPVWAELHHQNVLSFYGIVMDTEPRFYMVSPWQEGGNLLDYIKKNREADKNRLLLGSAVGLSYLHSKDVIHGSVRCRNVLVSHEGEPQICDFGIVQIVEETPEMLATANSSGDAARYAAPEQIGNSSVSATKESDTFSFGMLILECITEEKPFSNCRRDVTVLNKRTTHGMCPPRPDEQDRRKRISDELWELMMRCWSVKPDHRPTMEQVYMCFRNWLDGV